MASRGAIVGLVLAVVCALWAGRVEAECVACERTHCPIPKGCSSGMVRDECNCCDVCGKAEFQLCSHKDIKTVEFLGHCGDNLKCLVREDVEPDDEPQAVCYCKLEGVLCGSDNHTYENMCQLMSAASSHGNKVTIRNKGPCHEVPRMVSPPDHIKEKSGSDVALTCEASGFPIPTVEWTWTRVDGQSIFLPSDDLRVSTNMRGGPERTQVTGWLQIQDLQKEHEGDYTCIVQNTHGVAEGTARVKIINEN